MYDIKGWDPQWQELREFIDNTKNMYRNYDLSHCIPILSNRKRQSIKVNCYIGSENKGNYKYCIKNDYLENEYYRLDTTINLIDGVTMKDVGIEVYYCSSLLKNYIPVVNSIFPISFCSIYMNIKSFKRIIMPVIITPFYNPNKDKKRNIEIVTYDISRYRFKSIFMDQKYKQSKLKMYYYYEYKYCFSYSRFYAIGANSNKLTAYSSSFLLASVMTQRTLNNASSKTGIDDNGSIKTNAFSITTDVANSRKLISFGCFDDDNYEGCGKY